MINDDHDDIVIEFSNKQTPRSALQRLPRYLRLAQKMYANNEEYLTCANLAKTLKLDATLIRKDIAFSGLKGRPKTGYKTKKVIISLLKFLKWDTARNAVLIGAGNMGRALLGYEKFAKHGINIIAAFDNNPNLEGKEISGKPIYPIHRLSLLAEEIQPVIGIITTPPDAAQEVANLLVKAGVKGIWNFSPTDLIVPEDVVVEDENLSCSLAILCSKL